MRHAYWCAQPTRGGSCDCGAAAAWEAAKAQGLELARQLGIPVVSVDLDGTIRDVPAVAPNAWAGDYITTSRELTYDLAQLLGDYTAGPDDDDEDRA